MNEATTAGTDRESGLGLVEVIVSMIILGLLAMAFLPFSLQATTASRDATTLASATRLVSGQLEVARAYTGPGCLPGWLADDYDALIDRRGVIWRVHAEITGTCSVTPVTYTVWVTRSAAPGDRLAEASTRVWADVP